jgi:small subunit ribosomal protein S16
VTSDKQDRHSDLLSTCHSSLVTFTGGEQLLAIRLMRMGAKKRPAYRVIVKEQRSKRDGAYLENLGTYNPTRNPAEVKLDLARVQYWIERGAQPSPTVDRLIKSQSKVQAASQES